MLILQDQLAETAVSAVHFSIRIKKSYWNNTKCDLEKKIMVFSNKWWKIMVFSKQTFLVNLWDFTINNKLRNYLYVLQIIFIKNYIDYLFLWNLFFHNFYPSLTYQLSLSLSHTYSLSLLSLSLSLYLLLKENVVLWAGSERVPDFVHVTGYI